MLAVTPIGKQELPAWVALRERCGAKPASLESFVDWDRQAKETQWFVGKLDEEASAVAIAIIGWHSPPGVARAELDVMPERRGRGLGSASLAAVGAWARERGQAELMSPVAEDDPESLAWAERRGFREVGRNSLVVLDLARVAAPEIAPPEGIAIVTWAERPDLTRAIYDVACEAYADVPGEEEAEMAPFEEWLSADMEGSVDRADATFLAVAAADEVVGYAKFSFSGARSDVAFHDMTGVKRAWRGRGIAGALKRAEIAWAKEHGLTRLETYNEERNEPIRRLNERHGYRLEPGQVIVRGPIPPP